MKRIVVMLFALLLVFLCACGAASPAVTLGSSELYTEKEIRDAVDVVIDRVEDMEHLTLLQVTYDEAYTLREMKYRNAHYGEETVIVLLADIHAGVNALAVGPFYPGRTCTDYQFVLTRNHLGRWIVQDSGYA